MVNRALFSDIKYLVASALMVFIFPAAHAAKSSINQWNAAIIYAGNNKVSSGVPVSNCHVLSNEHAVRGKQLVTVSIAGDSYSARVIATDNKNDLSLLKVTSCPIQQYAKVSHIEPEKGDKVTSVYYRSGIILSKIIKSTGNFLGYTNVVTVEDKEMLSMVIDDKQPQKGASGGGVSTQHGLVSVIFGVANRKDKPRTFAVDYFSLTRFLEKNNIH